MTLRLLVIWIQSYFLTTVKLQELLQSITFFPSSKCILIPGHDSSLCPTLLSPTHSFCICISWHISTSRTENNIMFEEHSGIACFPKSAHALVIVSIITLSLFITVFLFRHISCSPWSTASVLRSDFWVLGVIPQAGVGRTLPWCQPKINWYLLDETPGTHLPARPTLLGVWNLFVSYSSFIHSAYRFHSTHMLWDVVSGCAGGWMPSVGFPLAFYRLDVLKQIVYTFSLSLHPRFRSAAEQSSICIWRCFFWLIRWVFFMTEMSDICSPSLSSFFLLLRSKFLLRPL